MPDYRKALLANLRIGLKRDEFPNLFLNPEYSWHSGFTYWHRRLAGLVSEFAEDHKVNRREALQVFSKSVAWLELVPYHSRPFGLTDRIIGGLHSVELARSYVREVLLPRAKRSEMLIIAVRQAKRWGLKDGQGVIVYKGSQTRAAHLTPNGPAGRQILMQLSRARRSS